MIYARLEILTSAPSAGCPGVLVKDTNALVLLDTWIYWQSDGPSVQAKLWVILTTMQIREPWDWTEKVSKVRSFR